MATLHTYILQYRSRTMACGEILPDRKTGAALYAVSSGFTLLTEGMRSQEELHKILTHTTCLTKQRYSLRNAL